MQRKIHIEYRCNCGFSGLLSFMGDSKSIIHRKLCSKCKKTMNMRLIDNPIYSDYNTLFIPDFFITTCLEDWI